MSQAIRAVYVHVPFCHTLCGYCDFYSVVLDNKAVHPLANALLTEWARARESLTIRADSIFVGGGTPTTLPDDVLRRLLCAFRETLEPGAEFTSEANPATVSAETAAALVESGVTRASIGAQSFDLNELRVLERIHRPEQVANTVRTCRQAGIAQVNVDLIFAIPGQTLESWLTNLRRAIDLGTDHLSCYGLTYEPGTPLYDQLQARRVVRCENDLEADMYEATIDTLAAAGYEQYEISNFARPGCHCRHNLAIWRNEPYLGIGPSAAGYVGGVRYKNLADHVAYVKAVSAGDAPRQEVESPTPAQSAGETMMLGLRLNQGVDRAAFADRFGRDPVDYFGTRIRRLAEEGVMEQGESHLRLTRRGMLVADAVIAAFL
jgi:oxygen-independent coproporphyrinogen-3 oxidase